MEKHNKKVILVGKGGAGKDFLASHLKTKGYVKDVSYTTRPPRAGEIDGVDYHFVTEEFFETMKKSDSFYETAEFNGWHYGTSRKSWENSDLFIMTPTGVKSISKKDKKNCCIVYINISESIRRKRLANRTDSPDKIERRLEADNLDFKEFETKRKYNLSISDPDFDPDEVEESISIFRKKHFLQYVPNIFIVSFALFFYTCLPTIYDDFIKGDLLLTIFSFVFPAILITVSLLQWYKGVKDA